MPALTFTISTAPLFFFVPVNRPFLSSALTFAIFCASLFFLSTNSLYVGGSLLVSFNIVNKFTLEGGHFPQKLCKNTLILFPQAVQNYLYSESSVNITSFSGLNISATESAQGRHLSLFFSRKQGEGFKALLQVSEVNRL